MFFQYQCVNFIWKVSRLLVITLQNLKTIFNFNGFSSQVWFRFLLSVILAPGNISCIYRFDQLIFKYFSFLYVKLKSLVNSNLTFLSLFNFYFPLLIAFKVSALKHISSIYFFSCRRREREKKVILVRNMFFLVSLELIVPFSDPSCSRFIYFLFHLTFLCDDFSLWLIPLYFSSSLLIIFTFVLLF